ncbi:hypothetical protein M409DRAFT_23505 [Zasmidium cellare ATCC 36951]|uniref:Tautomerase cis-CaaD-like domain-containing protein n=1 Tax=Zasmidium cellare ATCC 36951 TaxID=1080233 RepID=A0A6A6CGN2_ZASCE|nr:uncharacterized protein M409DRAFT_23505 [Zasmidium cellare ATCC 36951]KAF2166315.1 hypothetical protein M409DRAFT_23505 [Zasmidium cellare ATCC 36951]
MPRYDILHVVPLTDDQYDDFQRAVTTIHTESFGVPSLFVNVAFTNITSQVQFIAGKKRQGNHLIAHVRLGNRTKEQLQKLATDIIAAWDRTVVEPHASEGKAETRRRKLHSVFILASDVVGTEAGLPVPIAGKEAEFLKSHYVEIKRRADEGDDLMVDTIEEIKQRGML